jgi:Uma2 family endonuclease
VSTLFDIMTLIESRELEPLLLDVSTTKLHVNNEQFEQLCMANPNLQLELSSSGELIVMPPTFASSGGRNFRLIGQFSAWVDRTDLGKGFDSSTGYDFSAIGGGRPAPDVSWIQNSRLIGVDLDRYLSIVPDFVIELRSSTDRLSAVQTKMREYQSLGVRLGWLINPQDRQVEIYRKDREVEILESPMQISGEDVLPDFTLNLTSIW